VRFSHNLEPFSAFDLIGADGLPDFIMEYFRPASGQGIQTCFPQAKQGIPNR